MTPALPAQWHKRLPPSCRASRQPLTARSSQARGLLAGLSNRRVLAGTISPRASAQSLPCAALTWNDISDADKLPFINTLLDEAELRALERDFLTSVRRSCRRLSEKQIAVIDRIIRRCMERGLRV